MSAAAAGRARIRRAGGAATALWSLLGGWVGAQPAADLILPPSADVEAEAAQDGQPATESERDPVTAPGATEAGPGRNGVAGNRAAAAEGGDGSGGERASAARIAAPAQAAALPMEEVIVVDESEWRLPDLGSEWRQAHAEAPDTGRIQLSFMPLYDPENADPVPDIFERNSALHRMQMIEVIRVRFGGRPQD